VIRIAFAIPAEQCRPRSGNLEKVLNHPGVAQIAHQEITLSINIGRNVMGDLPRVVAQAYPAVEGHRTEPHRTTVRSLVEHLPEADVVPPVRTRAVRLLERELFFFSFIVERTDRRVVIWPVKHNAPNDLDTRAQGDRVSRIPAGSLHRAEDVFLAADEP